jgi:hypothetical protein
VSDAAKALKPGDMTPVITTERGAYLIVAEDRREKKLTYDQVKHELAAELARDVWSTEAAKRDALKAFEDARASKQTLSELYPGTIQQQLEEQIQNQLHPDQQGSIVIESPDIPAAWKAGEDKAAPAGGSAPAPTGGSAAPAGAPKPEAAPKPAPITPSTDTLPAFHDPARPKARKEGPAKREKRLRGVDADGVTMLFDQLGERGLAGRVFEVEGNYNLVQLTARSRGDMKEFDRNADFIVEAMRKQRAQQLVHDWLKARCEELTKAGKIKPRADKIEEHDDKGNPIPTTYRPCMYFSVFVR